jgi:hypothetical protein
MSLTRLPDQAPGRRRGRAKLLLIVVLTGVVLMTLLRLTSGPKQEVAVPAYFGPGELWTWLSDALPTASLAIMNPNSGPGEVFDPYLSDAVAASRDEGLDVIGYVTTSYAQRPIADVAAEIRRFYDWYPIDGIFLDEVPTDCVHIDYFEQLQATIQAEDTRARIAINPGTQTNECYVEVADILLTFEGDLATWRAFEPAEWVKQYPADRFWHLIYGVVSIDDMQVVVNQSQDRHAGWIYVTPETLPNPWYTLPPYEYWLSQLDAVGHR